MTKNRRPEDPFAQREADNYANPIPSRELILEELEKLGKPASLEQLWGVLQLHDEDEREALRRRMIAMSRDGQIISNRRGVYGLAAHMDLQRGRIQGHKDGFGFFIPDAGGDDFYLSPREMANVFDGDKVLARHNGFDSRGRKEGTVVEILERRYKEIVGRYYKEQGFGLVVPDSKRVTHEILIPDGQSRSAEDGQFVVVELAEYPSRRRKAIGRVTTILGDVTTPGLEIDIALRSHDIPHLWPSAVNKEMARFPKQVADSDTAGRFDLRDLPFVTIDGEDAKDFDDAVYARRHQKGGWTLYVAIADVSHYVQIGSALDEEAIERGTSVYFPGHVVPMLPEKLSNGLCSLKPEVDRLTMVCEMEIDASGEMQDFCFYEGLIHSHARLTYTEVADMVQQASSATGEKVKQKLRQRYKAVIGDLENLYSLYLALRAFREAAGAMEFASTETRIVFDEERKIREIVPVQRNDAHRLIEECMLCANVAAARLLEANKTPALYRVHEGPNPDKLDNLREYLQGQGLYLAGGDNPEPQHYAAVLQSIAQRPDRHLIQVMLIRSMMQAVYAPENLGHFGLGFEAYTHFTSPIRRYPDLLVHRAIRYLVRNQQGPHLRRHEAAGKLAKSKIYPYDQADMDSFGETCSNAERRADAASYAVIDWLKCEYMQNRVGDEFEGSVSSVTSFGLFVELTDIYIEGLVHVTELSNDYYRFDPVHHCLQGERSGVVYRMGDSVRVKVVRVDLDDKKIDLAMLGKTASAPAPEGQSKAANKRGKQASSGKKKAGKKKAGEKKAGKKNTGKKKTARGRAGKKVSKKANKKAGKKSTRKAGKKPGRNPAARKAKARPAKSKRSHKR